MTTRTIITRAKTPAGIARAYLAQYGRPGPTEWSAGGSASKADFRAVPIGDGSYRLVATSLYGGRPAGVIHGPRFIVSRSR